MKTIWISSLVSSKEEIQNLMSLFKPYGIEVNGHYWEDDLEKMAWIKGRDELLDPKVSLWLILTSPKELAVPTLRYGLSLLSLTVQAQRGPAFPTLILLTASLDSDAMSFPTPLKGVDWLTLSDPALAAKIVAKVHAPAHEVPAEYRLDVYGNPQIGQWFEVGPSENPWLGAMFGVEGAKISFHAVGPKGRLPSRSTLNYPVKDMEVTLGDKKYVVWAVQNELEPKDSYFLKVEGFPDSVIFGPHSSEEEAEVYVVQLK